jgi:hypothetical protein
MNLFREYRKTMWAAILNFPAMFVLCFMIGVVGTLMGFGQELDNVGRAIGSTWTMLTMVFTAGWGFVAVIIGMCGDWAVFRQWAVWFIITLAWLVLLSVMG